MKSVEVKGRITNRRILSAVIVGIRKYSAVLERFVQFTNKHIRIYRSDPVRYGYHRDNCCSCGILNEVCRHYDVIE